MKKSALAGDAMMLAATMIFGAMTIFSKQILAELEVFNMVALRFLIAYAFIFSFTLEDSFRLPQSPAGWGQLLYLALGCGALGFILQTAAEKYSSADHATIIYASQPVFVAVFSYLMLAEPISLRQIAGIIIVFVGVLITVKTNGELTDERKDELPDET